jgi:hypothetical protein
MACRRRPSTNSRMMRTQDPSAVPRISARKRPSGMVSTTKARPPLSSATIRGEVAWKVRSVIRKPMDWRLREAAFRTAVWACD